jgi:hypothetical protein
MKLVLRTILGTSEIRSAGGGFEVARRRNITIRPARRAVAVLSERIPAEPVAA